MLERIELRNEDISRECATLETCKCLDNCDKYILIICDLEYGILKHEHVTFEKGFNEIIRISKSSNSDYLDLVYANGERTSVHEFVNSDIGGDFVYMGESLE